MTGSPRSNRPVLSLRCGSVGVAVWENSTDDPARTFHSATLQRRYRAEDGGWKEGALRYQDLPAAIRLLQRAMTAIEQIEDNGACTLSSSAHETEGRS